MKKLFTLLTMLIVAISTSWAGVTIFTSKSQETTDGNWTLVGSNADASSQSSVVFPTPAAETGFPTGTQSKTDYYCKVSGTGDLGAKLTSAKCVTIAGLSSGDQIVVYWFATNTTSTTINLSYATSATKTGTLLQGINTSSVTSKNVYSTTFTALSDGDINKIENGYEGSAGLAYVSSNNSVYIYAIKITASTPATKHSVTYNLGGGSSATGAPTHEDEAKGAKFNVAAAPTDLVPPTGEEFKCWNDGTNDYNPGAEYTMGENDVEFTAVYQNETVKYSVEYKLNGGSGDAPTQASLAEGSVFTVANAEGITAPEGKVFKCWNDGSADYAPGANYTMGTSNVTLTAQWLTNSDATFSNGQYVIGGSALDLSTLFISSSTGAVTYTVKSAGDTGAAIAGTSFTATEAGTATVTATQAATATYAGATLDATITVGGTTGANTITYTLDIPDSEDKNKQDINSTNVSSSLFVNSLVGITNNTGGTYDKGSKTDLTVKIPTPATYDANNYMSVGFSVNSGYVFVPSSISVKAQPVTTAKDVKLVLTDGTNSIEKTVESVTAGSIATVTMSNEDNVSFSGNVTLKIYCYGATDKYRLGSPITVDGTVLPAPKEITIGTGGFSTFAGEYNYTVSGAKALAAQNKSTSVGFIEIPSETVIPANTGVVLKGTEGYKATITYTTADAETVTTDMVGVTEANPFAASDNVYVIATKTAGTKFYKYTGSTFPLGKAYLNAPANAPGSLDIDFGGETAINGIDANDNANSAAPVKVIKNGKLYIGKYNVAGQLVK